MKIVNLVEGNWNGDLDITKKLKIDKNKFLRCETARTRGASHTLTGFDFRSDELLSDEYKNCKVLTLVNWMKDNASSASEWYQ